jgi:hypothetical protein
MPTERDTSGDPSIVESEGRGNWVLGRVGAPGATCGDVTVRFRCRRGAPQAATVEWRVPPGRYPDDARDEVIAYLDWYLRSYLEMHPVGALHVDVVDAAWLAGRTNEPDRAAFLAVHAAMSKTDLPPRELRMSPNEDSTS